jgi:hypothetical protein
MFHLRATDLTVIAHHCKTSNLMLYVIFFYSKGLVLQIPVLKGSSFYRESFRTQLVDFYQKRRWHTGVLGIKEAGTVSTIIWPSKIHELIKIS